MYQLEVDTFRKVSSRSSNFPSSTQFSVQGDKRKTVIFTKQTPKKEEEEKGNGNEPGLFGCCQGKVKVSGPQAATTTTTTTGDEEEEEEEPDLLDALEDWADEEEE